MLSREMKMERIETSGKYSRNAVLKIADSATDASSTCAEGERVEAMTMCLSLAGEKRCIPLQSERKIYVKKGIVVLTSVVYMMSSTYGTRN